MSHRWIHRPLILRAIPALLCFVVSAGILATHSSAAAADPAVPLFGNVDLQKVQDGYAKRADLESQVQTLQDDLTQRFNDQQGSDMLTFDQQQQLGALLAKPVASRSDQEKATIDQLKNGASHDAQELAALQQKQDLTDQDKARLTVLTTEHQTGQQALQKLRDAYQDQIKAQSDKVSGQFTALVKTAIVAIAKERGLSVVFDSNVAIYTTNDITDDVLKRINK